MFISNISIRNFKSISYINLPLIKGKNILIGKNNAGKSNILKAIDLVIGESDPSWNKKENITPDDFYKRNISQPIEIFLTLTREKFDDYPEPLDFLDNLTGALFYYPTQKINDFSNLEKVFPDLFPEIEETKGKIWVGTKSYCKNNTFSSFFNNVSEIKLGFAAKIDEDGILRKAITCCCKEFSSETYQVLHAIGPVRKAFLESSIIPAFRTPQEQLKVSTWSWFGKLVHRHVEPNISQLDEAFSSVKKISDSIFLEMGQKINEETDIAFPGTTFHFQLNPNANIHDIAKGMMIYIDDGFNSRLEYKGSGLQSYMIISLFDYYIHNVAPIQSGALLGLEEPELFLHPHARRLLSARLNHFLNKRSNNQVILTTHSSDFISADDPNLNIIVVNKKKGATTAKQLKVSSVKIKQILLHRENIEMLFADAVVLTEDLKFFLQMSATELADIILGGENWLDSCNISILNCGGKDEIYKYASILQQLEIPFYVVADFDFLKEGLNNYLKNLTNNQEETDLLNELKSKIFTDISGKRIDQISADYLPETKKYLKYLQKTFNIFLLEGELEDLYKEKPKNKKAQGVLETLNKVIEENKKISDFIHTSPLKDILIQIAEQQGLLLQKDSIGTSDNYFSKGNIETTMEDNLF